jgi:hypothetical protein
MLAIILTIAVDAASSPAKGPPDGTYAYTGTRNGQPFGKTSATIAHAASSVTISEDTSGSIDGNSGSAKATLTLGADLAPTGYSSTLDAAGQSLKSSVTFSGTGATLAGAQPLTFNLSGNAKHFIVLDGALLSGYLALPAQMILWNDAPAMVVVPVYAQAAVFAVDPNAKPVRPIGVPAADASLSVTQPLPFVEWYDPSTLIVDELDMPAYGVVISRKP